MRGGEEQGLHMEMQEKELDRDLKMERVKRTGRFAILAAGIGMLAFGIARGELLVIFQKAALICLECIGIG